MNAFRHAELILLDSNGSESRIWPSPCSIPEGAIQENRTYTLELRGVIQPDRVELFIDDLTVEALRSPNPTTAKWRWSTGFYAGSLSIRLTSSLGGEVRMVWTTDPDMRKLTRAEYDLMVREILDDTFALFSLSQYRYGVSKGCGLANPPIARLEYLRSRLDEIERVVRRIDKNPVRVLTRHAEILESHKARVLTSAELLRSLASQRVLRETRSPSTLPARLNGFWPAKMLKQGKLAGLDTREHRDIKSALTSWRTWLQSTAKLLSRAPASDPTLLTQRKAWARRCGLMANRVSTLLALPLFQGVADTRDRIRTTPIYRRNAEYRRFYTLRRDFERGLANIVGAYLELPLARTFELYELWAFLRLLHAAAVRFAISDLDVRGLFQPGPRSGALTLSAGTIRVPLTDQITLQFQREYREYWLADDGAGSYSRAMRPDVTIKVADQGRSLIVLDAKYRLGQQLNDAISSIHTYRDALVFGDPADESRSLVAGAYLITPTLPSTHAEWRETPMPGRLFHPAYRSNFRFGAVSLTPGMSLQEVVERLETILIDSGFGSRLF